MKSSATREDRAGVPGTANRAGEASDRWSWVERCVWTERMLAALEAGPKGGKWYSLIDKVASPKALRVAFGHVKRNGGAAGVDYETVKHFEGRLDVEIDAISRALLAGTYRPQPLRRRWIPKAGERGEMRPLGIPTVRDRVVQASLKLVLEPIFEPTFHPDSYGYRPKHSAHQALQRVVGLLEEGRTTVVDVDFRKFFDSIPHERLVALIAERVSDSRVLGLLKSFLEAGILEGEEFQPTTGGTPQGGVISPLLANIYLNGLDQELAAAGHTLTRYADDFVVLCAMEEEAGAALAKIQTWAAAMELTVHPDKTRVVDMRQEQAHFDFLGFRFLGHRKKGTGQQRLYRFVRPASLQKLKDHLRPLTRRNSGRSLKEIVERINRVLRGWLQHFRSAHACVHDRLDQWLRRRLRSLLRRRAKRHGISRGSDHIRWPITFFANCGLVSLVAAHRRFVSPHMR